MKSWNLFAYKVNRLFGIGVVSKYYVLRTVDWSVTASSGFWAVPGGVDGRRVKGRSGRVDGIVSEVGEHPAAI